MNRREARKQAFLQLFQYKFQPEDTERLLGDLFETNNPGNQRDYIKSVVCGVVEKSEEIDKALSECTSDWGIDRISSVSIAALRLGAYEIMFMDDIPAAVSISEAVALAKEYEGEEAAPFVNGVLDGLRKKLTEESKA